MSLVCVLGWVAATPAQADTSYACSGDNTQVCPNVSMVHVQSDVANAPEQSTSSGTLFAPKRSTQLHFSYSSHSVDSNRLFSLQFFNITPGLKLIVTSTDGSSTVCNPQLAIQKSCQTRLDANGNARFSVAVFDAQDGTGFNYQLVGATAWTSNFVRVTFTTSGTAPDAPLSCAAQNSQVCAPVSSVSVKSGNQTVKLVSRSSGDGSMTIAAGTKFLTYHVTTSSGYAYKTIYVDFFGASPSGLLAIDTSANTQGIGCDKQVAPSNGCFIQLDSTGSATFIVALANAQVGDSYKFKINGAGYTSKYIQVTFASQTTFAPSTQPTPQVTAKGVKGAIAVSITQGAGKKATIKGVGVRSTSLTLPLGTSTIYVTTKPGKHAITVTIGSISRAFSVRTT